MEHINHPFDKVPSLFETVVEIWNHLVMIFPSHPDFLAWLQENTSDTKKYFPYTIFLHKLALVSITVVQMGQGQALIGI